LPSGWANITGVRCTMFYSPALLRSDYRGRRLALPVLAAVLAGVIALSLSNVVPASAAAPPAGGQLYSWGQGAFGADGDGSTADQAVPVAVSLPAGVTATVIATGSVGDTELAIGSGGNVYAWGGNEAGQLGNGSGGDPATMTCPNGPSDVSCAQTPVVVSLPAGVTPAAVAAGDITGYALVSGGTVYAWGGAADGELGNDTLGSKSCASGSGAIYPCTDTPVTVLLPAGVTATAISAGSADGYAVGSDGNLYAWGSNLNGQLGNGTVSAGSDVPVQVSLPAGVTPVSVDGGDGTAYAIGSDGKLYAWGAAGSGQLGNGTLGTQTCNNTTCQTTPVLVSFPAGVQATAVAAGDSSTYAIGSDGRIYAWGSDENGSLGGAPDPQTCPVSEQENLVCSMTPVLMPFPSGVTPTALVAGGFDGYVIGSDGNQYSWGWDISGSTGSGPASGQQEATIVAIPAGYTLSAIGSAFANGYAILSKPTPAAPAGLTAVSPTLQPSLSWNPVSGAASYNIYRNGTLIAHSTGPAYTDTTAAQGTYSYDVTAVSAGAESGPSNTVIVEVGAAPSITSSSSASTGMRTPFDFTVTTSGDPTAAITESGTLPSGVTFTDNSDGTADLSGTAAAGTAGTYPITITASNGLGTPATQPFVLTVTSAASPPAITSDNSDTETFGAPFTFTVTTTGYPVPALTKTGSLPPGVTFTDNGDGTATISGTPASSAIGSYAFTLKAKSSAGTATQSFTLTITKAPVIKNIRTTTVHVGTMFSLTITARGQVTPALSESGALPGGVTFTDNSDGTATIAGVPAGGSGGAYAITITAVNQLGSATQTFTLKVDEAPAITSPAAAAATTGTPFTFTVTATGYPAAAIRKTGSLPRGLTYKAATGTISGTPSANSAGTYPVTFTVKNSSGTATQAFVLTVQPPT
jgi:large repetitive protein